VRLRLFLGIIAFILIAYSASMKLAMWYKQAYSCTVYHCDIMYMDSFSYLYLCIAIVFLCLSFLSYINDVKQEKEK